MLKLNVVLTMRIKSFNYIAYRYKNGYLIRVEQYGRIRWHEARTLDYMLTDFVSEVQMHMDEANEPKFTPVPDDTDDKIPF